MNNGNNPLGKFAVYVAVGTAVAAVALALLQHFLISLEFAAGKVDPFIDNVALLAIGIIFGGAGGQVLLNGTVKKVNNLEHRVTNTEAAAAKVNELEQKVVEATK